MAEGFVHDFRRFFLRGLAAALPTLLTLALLVYVFTAIQKYAGNYLTEGARWCALKLWVAFATKPGAAVPALLQEKNWNTYFWWAGFLFALVLIYVFGRFIASFIGRSLWRLVERTFFRLPIVKQVYPYIKQVTDFLFSNKRVEFSRVVAVEYPRKGVWSLGLVTGPGMRAISKGTGSDLLTVFIPSSPTPVTGYTISIRRDEVIDLPITIDQALRYTVSGGVIMPLSQQPGIAETEQARLGVLPPGAQKESEE